MADSKEIKIRRERTRKSRRQTGDEKRRSSKKIKEALIITKGEQERGENQLYQRGEMH